MSQVEPILHAYTTLRRNTEVKDFTREEVKRVMKGPMLTFTAISSTNEISLKPEDTLQYYINYRVEKWKSRLSQKQKLQFFLSGYSLTDSVAMLEKSSAGPLALTWDNKN